MRARLFWISSGVAVLAIAVCGWTAMRWTRAPRYRWQQVQSSDARFRISFPGRPIASQEHNKAANGTDFISNQLAASPRKGAIYSISWWENSAQTGQSTDELFAKFRECNLKVFQGKIVSERDVMVHGYRARDTEVWSSSGFIVHDRTIRAGSRLYSVVVLDSSGQRDQDNVYKFFDSMTID